MATQTFYEVNFDDGSYCDNLFPENILVSVLKAETPTRTIPFLFFEPRGNILATVMYFIAGSSLQMEI